MLARMLGNYATAIGHSPDDNKTHIRLPSSAKKIDSRGARASIGTLLAVCISVSHCIARGYIIYKNVHKNVGDLLGASERRK